MILRNIIPMIGRGAPAGGGSFVPTDIASLRMMCEADALSLSDNDMISSFTDLSGNGNHPTASELYPIYKASIDGAPAVYFDAASSLCFQLPNFSAFTAAEVFVVIKLLADPPASGKTGLWIFGTGSDTHFPYADNNIYESFGTNTRKDGISHSGVALNTWRLYNVASQANDWKARLDTVQIYSTSTNTVALPSAGYLGRSPTPYLDGYMRAIYLFNAVLSPTDRANMESYIDSKYSLSY